MAVFTSPQTDHKRGFLSSNGVEVSVFAMLAGLGVAVFLALTILGGDPLPAPPLAPIENSSQGQDFAPSDIAFPLGESTGTDTAPSTN